MRGRRRGLLLLAAVALGLGGGVLVAPGPALAAELKISPPSGFAGSSTTVFFGGFTKSTKCPISVFWDGPNGTLLTTTTGVEDSVAVTVPGAAAVGNHTIYAVNSRNCNVQQARGVFEVLVRPRPTPSKTPPPTKPPTPRPRPSTSTPPPVTDPDPNPETPTPTPTPSATPTLTAPPTPTVSTTPSGGSGGELSLDRDNVRPGEPLTATGTGCDPGAPVVLSSGPEQIGAATADSSGAFVAPVQFALLRPGRHAVTAVCGPVLTTHVDLIVSSSTSGQAGTVVVLIFFLLVGFALLRWQFNTARR